MKIKFHIPLLFLLSLSLSLEAKKKWDYVIIGGGSAGSILARKLSDNPEVSVLVIEAGENRTEDPLVLDPDILDSVANTQKITFDPKYSSTYSLILPFFSFDNAYPYSVGTMLGGSSAHNYLLAVRGTPSIYNTWAKKSGNKAWRYSKVLHTMKALEHYTPDGTHASRVERGFHGPIYITQSPSIGSDPFSVTFETVTGAPAVTDYNNPRLGDTGVSAFQQFITPGSHSHRSFSGREFLRLNKIINKQGKGLNGRRLRIKYSAFADRIEFDDQKRAVAVVYLDNSGTKPKVRRKLLKKDGEVIICAGAFASPAILERSGIGNRDILKRLGIDVIVDNPNVGDHLQCQYGAAAFVPSSTTALPFQGYINGSPYMPADDVRRMQVLGVPAGTDVVSMEVAIENPHSRGKVHIVNRNPLTQPLVTMNFFSDGSVTDVGSDAYLMVSYYKIMQSFATALGTTLIYPTPASFASDDLLLQAAQNPGIFIIFEHAVGTTRMNKSKHHGVVDGKLRVHGVKGVRVADIGIEPVSVNGNTCYSAYVIGLTAAKILGAKVPPAL